MVRPEPRKIVLVSGLWHYPSMPPANLRRPKKLHLEHHQLHQPNPRWARDMCGRVSALKLNSTEQLQGEFEPELLLPAAQHELYLSLEPHRATASEPIRARRA